VRGNREQHYSTKLSTSKSIKMSRTDDDPSPPSRNNLKADAQLCTLLHDFSIRVQQRSAQLIDAKMELEQKLRITDQAAERVRLKLAHVKAERPIFFQITDDPYNNPTAVDVSSTMTGHNVTGVGRSTSNSAVSGTGEIIVEPTHTDTSDENEELMRDEEYVAITDGISALKYFHYHSKSAHEYYASDHYFVLEEDDAESPQYYDSAEADVFNQRPLPFIIGSKDFMESQDGGIGSEQDADSNPSNQ